MKRKMEETNDDGGKRERDANDEGEKREKRDKRERREDKRERGGMRETFIKRRG